MTNWQYLIIMAGILSVQADLARFNVRRDNDESPSWRPVQAIVTSIFVIILVIGDVLNYFHEANTP